jgi:hypothetical protein
MPPRDLAAALLSLALLTFFWEFLQVFFVHLPNAEKSIMFALKRFNIVSAGFLAREKTATAVQILSLLGGTCHLRGNSQPGCWVERSSRCYFR